MHHHLKKGNSQAQLLFLFLPMAWLNCSPTMLQLTKFHQF